MLTDSSAVCCGPPAFALLKAKAFFCFYRAWGNYNLALGSFEEQIGLFSFPVSLRRIVTLGYSVQRGPCEASAVASNYYHRSGRLCGSNDKLAGTPVEPWDRRNGWDSFFPKVPGFVHRPSRIS